MEEKIEIHDSEKNFKRAQELLQGDPNICQKDKEIIAKFILDCEMGKTLKNTAKKKIGIRRLTRLINILRTFSRWFNKPFNELTQEDLDKVMFNLEKGVYKKSHTVRQHNGFAIQESTQDFNESSKSYFKRAFKKFNKWLKINNINTTLNMDHIEIIDYRQTDFEIVTRKELNILLEHADSTFWRAFISVLWSCGFRIEETLNVRIKHVILPHTTEYDNETYAIKIVFSKNKFGIRNTEVLLENANKYLAEWLDDYKSKDGYSEDSQLFPIKYITAFTKLRDIGNKHLNKKIGCHTFRHSSATYWCTILPHAKLCCLMGWSLSSSMPDVYIKRSSVMADKTALKLVRNVEMGEIKQENDSLKEELSILKAQQQEQDELLRAIANKLSQPVQIPYNGQTADLSVSGLSIGGVFKPHSKNKDKSDRTDVSL